MKNRTGRKFKHGILIPDAHDLLLAMGSGILLFLSFPKFGNGALAWIFLAPLFYALREKTPGQGMILGLIAGLTAHIGIMYWITLVVVNYGYLPYPVGIAAMLLLSGYLSLYTSMFAATVVYFQRRELPFWMTAPVIWTVLEYAKSHLLTGFPWENLGYSQYQYLPVIQVADITGVYGVSFLIVLVNALVFEAVMRRDNKKVLTVAVAAATGVMLVVCGYGWYRLEDTARSASTALPLNVRMAQGNIDQSVKWHPQYQRETVAIYTALSNAPAASRPNLIVWPETAYPAFFQDANDMHREVAGVAKGSGAWMLFGSPAYERRDREMVLFNSAFLLAPAGTIAGRYDKVHLVPYGEYVPLRRFFPFVNKLVAGIGDFGTGPGYRPLTMGTQRLGVLICYEGIFPEAARDYKREGADFLVNITNDAWFGRSSAPYQHLSMTVFRAVENRLDVVRAANTGISALISADGSIGARMDLFQSGWLDVMVKFYTKKTFYSRWGDIFMYLCIAALMLMFVNIAIRRKKNDRRDQ